MTLPGVAFINGRLSMGARMLLLSALFCIPIALLTALFVAQSWKDISFAQKEIAGAGYERSVWPVFAPTAAGAPAPAAALAAFGDARGRFDARFATAAASSAFARAASPDARRRAGARLMSGIADGSNLTLDPDLQTFYLIVAVAFRLPPMLAATSDLESATALAVGDADRPVRIAEALQTLRASADAAQEDYATAMAANASGETRQALAADAAALQRLAGAVVAHRDALIAGAPGSSASADIQALRAQLDRVWRITDRELLRLLRARVAALIDTLVLNLAVVLAFVAGAVVLGVVIVGGLARRTARLLGVMERLIAGETQLKVPHLADRNEGGRIAATVESFRLSLIDGARLRQAAAAQAAAIEDARAAAESERARVVRVLSVGELASSIAHEINQPLGAVAAGAGAATRWLERDPPNIERAHIALQRVARDAGRASAVLGRIRQILANVAPHYAEVDINSAVEGALRFTERERAHAQVGAQLDLTSGLPAVRGDRVQLQQVIINLTLNGIDAMRPTADRPRVLRLATGLAADGEVLVSVADSGVGLAPDVAGRLFDPFFTTKPNGMGIGLSISRSIIESHGGRISVEAGAEGGAVFRFTLQRWTAEAAASGGLNAAE